MRFDCPDLVDYRNELIHEMRNIFEMRRDMIAYVNGLLAKPSAELRNVGYSRSIERPEHVLVKASIPFFKAISTQFARRSY